MSIENRANQTRAVSVKTAISEKNVGKLVQSMMPQISRALPTLYSSNDKDRFARLLMTTLRKTPELMNCTQVSLLGSLLEVARLGLDPSSDLVYLLPYKNNRAGVSNVEVIVSAKGFIELALRSGRVLKVESRAVFDGDDFEVDYGKTDASSIIHKPSLTGHGPLTHAWARAIGREGQIWIEVMDREQIEAISKGRRGPWQTDFDEMARKTVIRRLAKQLPQTNELSIANRVDDSVVVDYDDSTQETKHEYFDRGEGVEPDSDLDSVERANKSVEEEYMAGMATQLKSNIREKQGFFEDIE